MQKIIQNSLNLAVGLIVVFIILLSTVPPVSRDAQTHHLALPKIWINKGVLSEVRDMDFSYYPQLLDLLYYLPVKYDVVIIAKYIHFGFGLATAWLLFLFIRRKIGRTWGLLGSLMFLTIPVIVKLSVTVYVDLGLLFFFSASLFSLFIWLEDTKKYSWLIIGSVCSGLSLSVKYNAMLSVTILGLLLGYFFIKVRKNKNYSRLGFFKFAAVFAFFTLLVFSPWMMRNISLTGNPIYPLHQSFFSKISEKQKIIQQQNEPRFEELKPLTFRSLAYKESVPYILALPIRVFFEGKDDNPQFFDGKLNPFLILFPFLLFLSNKKRWQNQSLLAFVSLTLLYTMFATSMRIRYIITIVPPLIVLSIFGLYQLNNYMREKKYFKRFNSLSLFVLVSSYFTYNLFYAVNLYNKINPLPYIKGEVSRDEYISQRLPYYMLNKLANTVVSPTKKLLAVYTGNRRYYIDVPLSLDSALPFVLAGRVNNSAELIKEFSARNITHILVRTDLFQQELSRSSTRIQQVLLEFFSKHAELLKATSVFALYKIKPVPSNVTNPDTEKYFSNIK